jgi:hypothetical protein
MIVTNGGIMLDILFWLLIGAFIGWHFPEPSWAKVIKEKITATFKKQ